jgi:surface protein
MVKGDGKYLSVDYEKVVDVFLAQFTQEDHPNITREVLHSILFVVGYSPSTEVVNELAISTFENVEKLIKTMLQFPLKQVGNESGDIGVLGSLYNGGDTMLKLSDVSETERFARQHNISLMIAVSEWLSDTTVAEKKYGPIGGWSTSKVTSMKNLFKDAASFNKNLSEWNVSNVTDMTDMFSGATAMNGRTPSLPDTPDPAQWSTYWA